LAILIVAASGKDSYFYSVATESLGDFLTLLRMVQTPEKSASPLIPTTENLGRFRKSGRITRFDSPNFILIAAFI